LLEERRSVGLCHTILRRMLSPEAFPTVLCSLTWTRSVLFIRLKSISCRCKSASQLSDAYLHCSVTPNSVSCQPTRRRFDVQFHLSHVAEPPCAAGFYEILKKNPRLIVIKTQIAGAFEYFGAKRICGHSPSRSKCFFFCSFLSGVSWK